MKNFKLICGWSVVGVFGLLLAGCKGIPTKAEKEARRQAETVAAGYRPQGAKPVLPALTADSSLSNFLAYAMLNRPEVEAAYYDWAASIERMSSADRAKSVSGFRIRCARVGATSRRRPGTDADTSRSRSMTIAAAA